MTRKQYLAALETLGLTPSGRRTADVLGLSLRQLQRIGAGESAVPSPIAKLLKLAIAGKVTLEEIEAA